MPFGIGEVVITLAVAASWLLVAYPAMRLCRRLGFPPAVGLLALVPVVNVALLWFVAFSSWPALAGRQGH